MNFLKKLGRVLAAVLLPLFLLLATASFLFMLTIGQPKTVKGWLDNSDVYAQIPGLALNELSKNPEGGESFKDPGVEKAIKDVLNPQLLRTWSENFIDGTYHWLEGKSAQPDFVLDLTPLRQGMTDFVRTRLNSLPACDRRSPPPSEDQDFLEITCLPRGTDVNAQVSEFEQELFSGDGPFSKSAITVDNMRSKDTNESPFDDLKAAPKIFQTLKKLPFIFSGLTILAAALLVWLHDEKRRAWRKIAHTFLPIGLILLLGGIAAFVIFNQPASSSANANDAMDAIGMPVLRTVVKSVARTQIWFGAAYTLIAVVIHITLHKLKPSPSPTTKTTPSTK